MHIDYEKAPNVIQRFGDVKKLITQTIDPMLSAYFRDVAHKKTMLELVHSRDEIQGQARTELKAKFEQFDIECVDVLIGRPEAQGDDNKIENLLEQLRLRQLSLEQIETYSKQEQAAGKLKDLNNAIATATMQEQLTQSKIQIEIISNRAEADLAKARKDAERRVVTAKPTARAWPWKGAANRKASASSARRSQSPVAKGAILRRSRLYAVSLVADSLAHSQQPLVPATALGGDGSQAGMLGTLMSLLVADKLGIPVPTAPRQPARGGRAAEGIRRARRGRRGRCPLAMSKSKCSLNFLGLRGRWLGGRSRFQRDQARRWRPHFEPCHSPAFQACRRGTWISFLRRDTVQRFCGFGHQTKKNGHGKKFRKSQERDLQDGCSEIEALLQVRHETVRGRQEWRAGPRRQSGSAKLDREGQERSGSGPRH